MAPRKPAASKGSVPPPAEPAGTPSSPPLFKKCARKRTRASSSAAPIPLTQTSHPESTPVLEETAVPSVASASTSTYSRRAAGKRPMRSARHQTTQSSPAEQSPAEEYPAAEHPTIVFRDATQEARYIMLSKRKIVNTRYLDVPTLVQLGLLDDVIWLLQNLGWDTFMNKASPTHIDITMEILSSIYTKRAGKDNEIFLVCFRLQNKEYTIPLEEFNAIYGFPSNVEIHVQRSAWVDDFWRSITGEQKFNSKNARASAISNPCLRYVHRLLSNTVFARGDGDCMTRQVELLFLWSMLHQSPLNTGYFLAKHMVHVGKTTKGAIAIGGLFTPLALHCGYNPFGTAEATGRRRSFC